MIAIRAGGEGDVTSSHTMWKFDKGPDVPSAACDGRLIYLADDRGVATCLNAKTGKVVWGPERTEAGTVSASPIVADGRVYITNESAVTTVLAAGPEFKVLATNRLDDGYTISSPAIVDGRVYIRTSTHLVCIGD
jgi:outer membrane protein assembly factor BamB